MKGSAALGAKLLLGGAGRRNVGEVVTAKVGDRELAEDIVEDRGCVPDRVIALNEARRLEAGEVDASTYSSSGTPYCSPTEIAIAKLFIRLRKAAPSLCTSMK